MMREQEEAPDRLPAGTRHVPGDVLASWGDDGPARLLDWFLDPGAASVALAGGAGEALWIEQYRSFVRLPSARGAYGLMFRDLAVDANRPALVHCTTGKDRTGWFVAALQRLLGVPEEAVMDHYLASRELVAPIAEPALAELAERGGDPELFRPIFDVRVAYLEAAMDEVRAVHGSIEAYFAEGLGVDDAAQQALIESFTA